jgi:hypothetical protein
LDGSNPLLIYRDDTRAVDTRQELMRLRHAVAGAGAGCSRDAALEYLIDIAEIESALLDVLNPDADGGHPVTTSLRDASMTAGRVWLEACDCRPRVRELGDALAAVPIDVVPAKIECRTSEGYAYYALYPEAYAAAAQRVLQELTPTRVVVIGIRSIGVSLAAVVAAVLERGNCPVWSCSVRPHGHPFSRRVMVDATLAARWRAEAGCGALFVVVDEGPGLSGSSFASVVTALDEIGIGVDRVVLLPSWNPPPASLRSRVAQEIWSRCRRYTVDAAAAGISPTRMFGTTAPADDYSAGRWRGSISGPEENWPAIHPQHERWKAFVARSGRLIKFVGLGRYGQRCADRSRALFEIGEGPAPGELRNGFLDMPFVRGTPLDRRTSVTDASMIGRYIGRIAAAFRLEHAPPNAAMLQMVETNVSELLDRPFTGPLPVIGPTAQIDGRMLAHEWLRTPAGLVKTDALDHHCDHFFPGSQDPAWDLAAAIVEFGFGGTACAALLKGYELQSGDRLVHRRLPFHLVAYPAFRAGYASMAIEGLGGTAEGARFARDRSRYVAALRTGLSTPSAL